MRRQLEIDKMTVWPKILAQDILHTCILNHALFEMSMSWGVKGGEANRNCHVAVSFLLDCTGWVIQLSHNEAL
jgi:hypothetical protein